MSSYSAQQSSISENNRSRILQYLYRNGISSRAQIAKAIELTPAAITKITAKLLFRDVIEETGDMEGDKNRRSIGLNLNCAKYHVVGVKFARSLVQIAVFDLKCNRISLTDLPTVDEEHIPETVEQIRATVRQLIADDSSIVAVGMAVPGPYLVEEGRTALVSSMQGWRQVNFIKEFSEAFNVPVFVEQDARAGMHRAVRQSCGRRQSGHGSDFRGRSIYRIWRGQYHQRLQSDAYRTRRHHLPSRTALA